MSCNIEFPSYGDAIEMKFIFAKAIEDFDHVTGNGYTGTGCYYDVNFGFKKGDSILLGYGKTTYYELPVIFNYVVNDEDIVLMDLPVHPVLLGEILSKIKTIKVVSQYDYLQRWYGMKTTGVRLPNL